MEFHGILLEGLALYLDVNEIINVPVQGEIIQLKRVKNHLKKLRGFLLVF